ncbi:N(5)-hydroxyornithine transformylase PvdF [Variovorax sp. KBW07]|uniref:N(5)-hydroxyornithine transformylase PvdF n=1 Tax=Variovorax sp. KBW07 TaxID=2153358 RepID=UPI000F5839D5|nr:N(5)-hydroxyornithine transformylase PvdF [Variovorax sp. KBW07]RQO56217.1 N(5)-hydroxyornithine transformylase PvdF [Variovorax sp. KBW07]
MPKAKLVYVLSLRNAAADKAGQNIDYKGEPRYMKSPLEYLAEALDTTPLGDAYSLEGIVYDDDPQSPRDQAALADYGFAWHPERKWIFPGELRAQGRLLKDMLHSVPSSYRRLPMDSAERVAGKSAFERALLDKLLTLRADAVVLDGLLVILDELVRPGARFCRRIVNIHPGITRLESPFQRRGAYATLDALHGARGEKVVDWQRMATVATKPVVKTGASLHYVDNGIDSGEVIFDVLGTDIGPDDSILELRWNNFNRSLFPAMHQGLALLAPHL